MAAKTWEIDFRKDAIRASIQKLGPDQRENPFATDESFCVPVGEKPIPFWTPGKISLICIVIGFVFLVAGAVIISFAENQNGPGQVLLTIVGVSCSLSGFLTFFIPAKGDRMIISRMIGERARDKVESFPRADILSAELGKPGIEGQKLSIDGDDHVLVFFDRERKRLLIEGIGARYQICSEDVTHLAEFEFMNYLGAEISCRIDDETELEFAIAKVSILFELLRQMPLLFFLRKRIKNKVLAMVTETLDMPETIKLKPEDFEEEE
ncbi:MAG: hypothetical protein HUJ26_01195 [Planctomycetaceae bacterium]|nr:hypothetical protein [Planctomycetaceae bacterium]